MIIPMFQPIHFTKNGVVSAAVLNRWLFDEVYYALGDVRVGLRWEDMIKSIPTIEAHYPRLMINVSEETLESDYRFAAWIAQIECFRAFMTVELIIEMTEGVTDASLWKPLWKPLWKRWDELRVKGIPLVVDDYGYKNSMHERLEEFPWDGCKFDVKRLAALAKKDMKGVKFCQDSDIPLTGEQVDTEQLAQQSLWMGVDLRQGYHQGRPALLDGWVKKEKKRAVAK